MRLSEYNYKNDLSYADVVKFDMSNHVHVWDHSYSTNIRSVEENCTHNYSYVKNTSVTKIPVIKSPGIWSMKAIEFGDKLS
jgi:hypothetical protein